jgi:hypothetical protein
VAPHRMGVGVPVRCVVKLPRASRKGEITLRVRNGGTRA